MTSHNNINIHLFDELESISTSVSDSFRQIINELIAYHADHPANTITFISRLQKKIAHESSPYQNGCSIPTADISQLLIYIQNQLNRSLTKDTSTSLAKNTDTVSPAALAPDSISVAMQSVYDGESQYINAYAKKTRLPYPTIGLLPQHRFIINPFKSSELFLRYGQAFIQQITTQALHAFIHVGMLAPSDASFCMKTLSPIKKSKDLFFKAGPLLYLALTLINYFARPDSYESLHSFEEGLCLVPNGYIPLEEFPYIINKHIQKWLISSVQDFFARKYPQLNYAIYKKLMHLYRYLIENNDQFNLIFHEAGFNALAEFIKTLFMDGFIIDTYALPLSTAESLTLSKRIDSIPLRMLTRSDLAHYTPITEFNDTFIEDMVDAGQAFLTYLTSHPHNHYQSITYSPEGLGGSHITVKPKIIRPYTSTDFPSIFNTNLRFYKRMSQP